MTVSPKIIFLMFFGLLEMKHFLYRLQFLLLSAYVMKEFFGPVNIIIKDLIFVRWECDIN